MTEALKTFRDAAETHVRLSVMGTQSAVGDGTLPSQIGDEFVNLEAGAKGFQLLVWQIGDDIESDSNATHPRIGVQIRVLRQMGYPGDETIYLGEEMFLEQRRLLNVPAWRNLSGAGVQEIISGPAVDGAPERSDNMVSYTVELELNLDPA